MVIELQRIFVLILYQFKLTFPYWISGILAGVIISVFLGSRLQGFLLKIDFRRKGILAIVLASIIGAISPLCMYGTIPVLATLGKKAVPHHILVSFMVTSILINPNLFIFSFALGIPLALIRLFLSILAGITAGLLSKLAFGNKEIFNFSSFELKKKHNNEQSAVKKFFKELNGTIVKITPYFMVGILLTALFQRYFPIEVFDKLFSANKGLGVLMAASLGVPLYVCGGGTIPLLKAWLGVGLSFGSAAAFMITGPATKFTNLGAVKVILGARNFAFYIAFNILFAIVSGVVIDLIV